MSKIKDALKRYQAAAKTAQEKQRQARELYQPDAAERECARIAAWLDGERTKAQTVIDEEKNRRTRELDQWARIDGNKLTADVELLRNDLVDADQFNDLVNRYQDNYTMLNALTKYAERRNAEIWKEHQKSGNALTSAGIPGSDIPHGLYPVSSIPTVEEMTSRINKTAAGAYGVISMIDNGFIGYGGADSPMVTAAVDGFGELF